MERILRLERHLMRWLVADYQRRVLQTAVDRAYRAFAPREPRAVALLFDEHFIQTHLLPRLHQAAQTDEAITVAIVAELWARQFTIFPETRHHYIAIMRPAATRFLLILNQEMAERKTAQIILPCIEASVTP